MVYTSHDCKNLPVKFPDRAYAFVWSLVRRVFLKMGFHILRSNYSQPVPDEAELSSQSVSELRGLNMNDAMALRLLKDVLPKFLEDFRDAVPPLPEATERETGFYLMNGRFMAVDAHVYYAMIRQFRPSRIIEVGGGMSSRVAALACGHLQRSGSRSPELTVIEPFPDKDLRKGFPGLSKLVESKVQQVPLDLFELLGPNDILFIDSSHVLRSGGDVQYEYLEILPRLAPGVLVHIHDISLPGSYPKVYAEQGLYWNEQYLLQAFLAFNSRFEVLWPGNYMLGKYRTEVTGMFPEYETMRQCFPDSEPTSFWLRVCQC